MELFLLTGHIPETSTITIKPALKNQTLSMLFGQEWHILHIRNKEIKIHWIPIPIKSIHAQATYSFDDPENSETSLERKQLIRTFNTSI